MTEQIFKYGIPWGPDSQNTIPGRKADDAEFVEAVIHLAKVFGATDVEVRDVQETQGVGKVVTLAIQGDIDLSSFESTLKTDFDPEGKFEGTE